MNLTKPTQPAELKPELLPCAFCGKMPEDVDIHDNPENGKVYCFNPHCSLYRFEMSPEAWNTRPAPEKPTDCVIVEFSSRTCERGTHCCTVKHEKPMAEGVEHCGHWLIYFDDPDHTHEVYTTEQSARSAFKAASNAWNATLFREVENNFYTPSASGKEKGK